MSVPTLGVKISRRTGPKVSGLAAQIPQRGYWERWEAGPLLLRILGFQTHIPMFCGTDCKTAMAYGIYCILMGSAGSSSCCHLSCTFQKLFHYTGRPAASGGTANAVCPPLQFRCEWSLRQKEKKAAVGHQSCTSTHSSQKLGALLVKGI